MANLTRFDPFEEMTRSNGFSPFGDIDDLFRGFMVRPVFHGLTASPQMKIEVAEDEKAYTIKADIPGVKKEDIQVRVYGNLVSLSAEVKRESEKKEGKKLIHSERYYGQVSRSFTLAQDVDPSTVTAKYADGVLEAVLPKKNGKGAKSIPIT